MSFLPSLPVSPLTQQFGFQGPLSPQQQQSQLAFQQELARRSRGSPGFGGFAQRAGQFLGTGRLPPSKTVAKTEKFLFVLLCLQYFALTFLTLTLKNAFKEDDKTYCFMEWSKTDKTLYEFSMVWMTLFLSAVVFFSIYKIYKHNYVRRLSGYTNPMMYAYGFLLLLAVFAVISSVVMTDKVFKQKFETRYATEEESKPVEEEESEVEEFKPITELTCAVFDLETDYRFFQVLVGFCWVITAIITLILWLDPIYRESLLGTLGGVGMPTTGY